MLIEVTAFGLAMAIFLLSVLPNLANHPTFVDDEAWVLSASYKLAEEGVFGSDIFNGFYNADNVYLFNMPAHHFAVAGALKLLGHGILQARLVGVAYGVAVLMLSYLLARRLYGVAAALLTLGLLLFLRFNMGFDTGLPLQELAANLRYDLAPVPFVVGGALLLLSGPSLLRTALAGVLFGVALLMQFYAAFAFPIAVAFLLLERLSAAQRLKLAGGLLGAAALVGLPYGAYILAHPDEFKGQAGTIDRRADFDTLAFYVDNLKREKDRFIRPLAFKEIPRGENHGLVSPRWLSIEETLTRRPSAKLAVIVGLPAALFWTGRRALAGGRGDRLLFLFLGGLVAEYALLESTKFYMYWVLVLPFLCAALAGLALRLLQPAPGTVYRGLAIAAVAALLIFFAEGSAARLAGFRSAPKATDYGRLAATIRSHVPADARVVGSTSLWWAMRDYDYRSYFLFFYLTRRDAGPYKTTISAFLDDYRPQYLVMTRLAIGELEDHLIARDYNDWQTYLKEHATKVVRIEGAVVQAAYGFIDIWRFDKHRLAASGGTE